MILIFGGTTEGRIAAATAEGAGSPFLYSTHGAAGQVSLVNGRGLTGPLDAAGITDLCRREGVRLIVDAAHPFATGLHAAVAEAAAATGIPTVRFERRYPPRRGEVVWCDGWEEAVSRLTQDAPERLLVLTGVNTISRLRPFWEGRPGCRFRILRRASSREVALRQGIEESRLIYYDPSLPDGELFDTLRPDAIITKESGTSGGFEEKINAALERGIRVYAVCRPALPAYTLTVEGPHGLRRAIEALAPGFFELRSGFTTGACACAATLAALGAVTTGDCAEREQRFRLPDGEQVSMPVGRIILHNARSASATAVKDHSDDPDVLRGASVTVTVTVTHGDDIIFEGGPGVGRVTLPGTGLPVGAPAINRGPRQMIEANVRAIMPRGGMIVTISVEGGEQLARRTFNPRIGIEGGVSVIGTSGIVIPYSHSAFVGALRREMEVAVAAGAPRLVLSSGARSEREVRSLYPDLPAQAFIHYGNAVGDALRTAADLGVAEVSVAVMPGKGVKLAAGQLDTHSGTSTLDRDFLIGVSVKAGCAPEVTERIANLNMVSELTALPSHLTAPLWDALRTLIEERLRPIHPRVRVHLLVS